MEPNSYFNTSVVCLIQGNVNPIFLTQDELDKAAYPARCDEGSWDHTDACFAYQPKLEELTPDTEREMEVTGWHRKYIDCLSNVAHLYHIIQNVESGKTQAELMELLSRMVRDDFSHYWDWEK